MGSIIFYIFMPIVLRACCVGNYRRKNIRIAHNITHERYRVVEGQLFMVSCPSSVEQCTTGENSLSFPCGRAFIVETRHSGQYTCGRNRSVHLQVLERKSLRCFSPEDRAIGLPVKGEGKVPCPGLNCSDNTDVVWYKMKSKLLKAVSQQNRQSCVSSGWLHLCGVNEVDTGVYFCDRQTADNWTFRTNVTVIVVPYDTSSDPPGILYPDGNVTEEVELGAPHTLECQINFLIEVTRTREAHWYVNYNAEDAAPVPMRSQRLVKEAFPGVKVTQTAVIQAVAPRHLDDTYTCVASNANGMVLATVRLKQRHRVEWPSLVEYPIGPLLLAAGLGVALHAKWLELRLLFRSRFRYGNPRKAEKDFDVLLSFVWPRTHAAGASEEGRPGSDQTEGEGGSSARPPPEVLLPQVLEEWGHRLCLLERDVLPGGAYINDVVRAIQRSQMLICVLSADYLSNTDAVFILESGLQALLLKSTPKLLLVWTDKASVAQIKPDPPLPILVRRALKVLPSLDWSSAKPETTDDFWRSLKKLLPSEKVSVVTDVGESNGFLPSYQTVLSNR